MTLDNILKRLLGLPIDIVDWYLDILINGHLLLRLMVNLIVAALGWIIFILLHHVF